MYQRLTAWSVLLLLLAPAGASAQDDPGFLAHVQKRGDVAIPDFDSDAHCESLAADSRNDALTRHCLWVEEYARSELQTFWPSTSDAIREACIERIEEQSYAELAQCVLRLRRRR